MFWGDLLVTQALCNCVHAELSPSLETGTSDGQRGLGSRNSQMGTSNATMNHKDTVITKVQGLPLWNLERRPDCSEQWGFLFLMQAFSWGAKINHEFYTHGKHC